LGEKGRDGYGKSFGSITGLLPKAKLHTGTREKLLRAGNKGEIASNCKERRFGIDYMRGARLFLFSVISGLTILW
jgi:hypothetical protein